MNPEDLDWEELRSSSECLAGDIFFGTSKMLYPRQSSVISVKLIFAFITYI